jgi:DNA mismatch endonuclease (patch repair protein)
MAYAFSDVALATSKAMRANKSKNTKPELIVRRLVYGMGYHYRLHGKSLPGKPDLVFASRRKVIFVHGCFWHGHADGICKAASVPKTRGDYWEPKLTKNAERDGKNVSALIQSGWKVLTVWECWLKDLDRTARVLETFLSEDRQDEPHVSHIL